MTKGDFIAVIADKPKFPWARAELLVDVVFDCIEQSMSRGEKIKIRATRPNYRYTQAVAANTFEANVLNTLAANYGAGVNLLDFLGAPDTSGLTINTWVASVP